MTARSAASPQVVAHRGGVAIAPENTLAAFAQAVALGCSAIELDVRLTRDGVPVCFHDERLERLTGDVGELAGRHLASLTGLDVLPEAFDGRFPSARIPTLAEALASIPPNVTVMVELKADVDRPDALVAAVLGAIRESGSADRCRLISFEADLLRRVRSAEPGWALGPIAGAREVPGLLSLARGLRCAAIHVQHRLIDPALVAAAHGTGLLVNAWTVNGLDDAARATRLGVDELTTDRPDLFLPNSR